MLFRSAVSYWADLVFGQKHRPISIKILKYLSIVIISADFDIESQKYSDISVMFAFYNTPVSSPYASGTVLAKNNFIIYCLQVFRLHKIERQSNSLIPGQAV